MMQRLHELGFVSSWRDFAELPLSVVEDVALLTAAEAEARELNGG